MRRLSDLSTKRTKGNNGVSQLSSSKEAKELDEPEAYLSLGAKLFMASSMARPSAGIRCV
jgi:hypothetical protein